MKIPVLVKQNSSGFVKYDSNKNIIIKANIVPADSFSNFAAHHTKKAPCLHKRLLT